MQAPKIAVIAALFLAGQPSPGQRFREIATLPEGYAIADIAAGSQGRLFAVGSFKPNDPSRPEEDQADAFAAAFSADGQELLYLKTWIGRRDDIAVDVAVDSAGAAYVAIQTSSANLVGTPGAMQRDFLAPNRQALLAKLDPEGGAVYETFIGGTSDASISAVSVRDTGEAAVTGQSYGESFPTTPGAAIASEDSSAGFVVLLDPEGAAARFSVRGVGGAAITFDDDGNVYGGGSVLGPGAVPITPGAFQPTHEQRACGGGIFGIPCQYGYVFGLSAQGTELLFATFLTGDHGSSISSIHVDGAGDVLVAGSTHSENFPSEVVSKDGRPEPAVPFPPIIPPPDRGFVAKLNPAGTDLIFSTILGGSGADSLSNMLIGAESIYVAGRAGSHDLPGLSALPQCMPAGFVAELSLDGEALRAVTYDRLASPALALSGEGAILAAGGQEVFAVDLDAAAPRVACIHEAATQHPADVVAPGTLLSLFGQDLAPEPLAGAPDAAGFLPTTLGGVTVLVGGRPAPLLYVSPDQINLQVPFETELGTTALALDPPDALDSPRALAVEGRRPAVFLNPLQQDPCASLYPFYWENTPERSPLPLALNADGTVNSCQNPAQPGTPATLFLTGVGATDPARGTGAVNAEPANTISLGVSLRPYIEQALATSLAGSISSVWKVEFVIPADVHGPFALLPTVDGIAATPIRVVMWVDRDR